MGLEKNHMFHRNASVWIELLLVVCVYATDHSIHGMGATYPHLVCVWQQAYGLLRAHCMTANVKAYPISPTLPKNPNIHLQDSLSSHEDNPQC